MIKHQDFPLCHMLYEMLISLEKLASKLISSLKVDRYLQIGLVHIDLWSNWNIDLKVFPSF